VIDRKSRNRLAEMTRHLVSGQYTNYHFDDSAFNLPTEDPAIKEIYDQLWLLYDDQHEHKLKGKWSLTSQEREIVIRIVAFLKTDYEYLWPQRALWFRLLRPAITLLTFGFGTGVIESILDKGLDIEVWPFSNKIEYEQMRTEPSYLSGAS
jgi:hypothetical protein